MSAQPKLHVLAFIGLLFIWGISADFLLFPKQLAGSPSEFSLHELPSPLFGALSETSALLTTNLFHNSTNPTQKSVLLSVDSQIAFEFVVFAHPETSYTIKLFDPNGREFKNLERHKTVGSFEFGSDTLTYAEYRFFFPKTGDYQLEFNFTIDEIKTREIKEKSPQKELLNDAIVLLNNKSPLTLLSHLNTYSSVRGSQIGLVAQLYEDNTYTSSLELEKLPNLFKKSLAFADLLFNNVTSALFHQKRNNFKNKRGTRPTPFLDFSTINATLSIVFPNGTIQNVPMYDDGFHDDLLAGDGIYGGQIEATAQGVYITRAKFNVTLENGLSAVRSTQHIISVADGDLELTGTALATPAEGSDQMPIVLPVNIISAPKYPFFRVYAQVWGSDENGTLVSACWISSISGLTNDGSQSYLSLELNLRWLSLANVQAPYFLKTVSVQNVENYIILSYSASIPLTIQHSNPDLFFSSLKFSNLDVITEEMKKGKRPAFLQKKISSSSSAPLTPATLILVHGYCATTNPWSDYSSNFENAAYFLNAHSNCSNDVFAQLIAKFASDNNIASYSVAGYSQGGMAITHLFNYYWSGLDAPQDPSGRLLQSVATPFLGNSAAGSVSTLGKVFGVGCGEDYDLTKDGANLWGSGITLETRKNLWYYYVTYEPKFLHSYCNGATNLVLDHPNDGVVEMDATHLEGATDCGRKEGWCHKAGMQYPPAFSDQDRNKEINAHAARN